MTINELSVQPDPGGRDTRRIYQALFVAADNYVTGGVTLDLQNGVTYVKAPRAKTPRYVTAPNLPAQGWRFDVAQTPAGYTAEIIQNPVSPTNANFLLKIWSIASAAELAASGMPAGITGDVNGFVFTLTTPKKNG